MGGRRSCLHSNALDPSPLTGIIGPCDMRTICVILVAAFFSWVAVAGDLPSEPRMPLSNRVAEATLILVGKLAPPGNIGKHTTTSLQVEEVLCGSFPTNRTLFVSYSGTGWLVPDMVSKTDPPKRGSRWIMFLTDKGVKQLDGTKYFTRAVGPHKYAHDGFELAKDEALKQVRDLIAQRQK